MLQWNLCIMDTLILAYSLSFVCKMYATISSIQDVVILAQMYAYSHLQTVCNLFTCERKLYVYSINAAISKQ